MKDKKNLLLVINDPLEFKLLMNKFFFPLLLKKYNITLKCPVNNSKIFRQSILEEYPSIKFLESDIDNKLCFLDRINFWLRKELYFLLNAGKSESCFQKVFLNLDYFCRTFTKKSVMKNFNEFFSFLFNNSILRHLLKILIVPLILMAKLLNGYIFSYKTIFTKIYKDKNMFDYIFFGRPYSLNNIIIYSKFSNNSTKLITLCRNFDTPALKGIFTIPIDYTIVFDKFLYNHISNLNKSLNYGELILLRSPIKNFKIRNKYRKKIQRNILYATSASHFIINEERIIKLVYSFFCKHCNQSFNLYIRVHPNDNIYQYSEIINEKNVFLESKALYTCIFKAFDGRKESFPIINDIQNFYNELQNMDLVLSSGSTINYEAYLLGVKTAYLILDKRIEWIFRRDHLKILSKCHKIPIIRNLVDLKELIY